MGVVIETLIFCDGPNCPLDAPYACGDVRSESAKQMREKYGDDGWHYCGGKDYCPECWAKRRGGGE